MSLLDRNILSILTPKIKADLHIGGKLVRRGRPPSKAPKEAVSIRLSQDVLAHFRAGGPGWQTRIDAALREVVKRLRKRA